MTFIDRRAGLQFTAQNRFWIWTFKCTAEMNNYNGLYLACLPHIRPKIRKGNWCPCLCANMTKCFWHFSSVAFNRLILITIPRLFLQFTTSRYTKRTRCNVITYNEIWTRCVRTCLISMIPLGSEDIFLLRIELIIIISFNLFTTRKVRNPQRRKYPNFFSTRTDGMQDDISTEWLRGGFCIAVAYALNKNNNQDHGSQ